MSLEEMIAESLASFPPHLDPALIPEGERKKVEIINISLSEMATNAYEFQSALALFDHVTSLPPQPGGTASWQCMVAREGLYAAWNFGEAVKKLENSFRQTPTLVELLGKNAVRPIKGAFGAAFPDLEDSRNTSAHPVDHALSRVDSGKHTINGVSMFSCLEGRKLIFTRNKRIVSVEISDASLTGIRTVRNMAFSLFRPVNEQLASRDSPNSE